MPDTKQDHPNTERDERVITFKEALPHNPIIGTIYEASCDSASKFVSIPNS